MKPAVSALTALLRKNKYVVFVLCLGLVLLLLPSGDDEQKAESFYISQSAPHDELSALLSEIDGVGLVTSLVSEHGAVIVCDGAQSSQTRLDVVNAVSAYTGLGASQISVYQRK